MSGDIRFVLFCHNASPGCAMDFRHFKAPKKSVNGVLSLSRYMHWGCYEIS